eukprot:TRINITY_DN5851_c0_g3_i1.p1 TRINITY_DN5851_c0_g3~~TRINITY_DN5851_c0_g3_i1.p1  ORF type:complete len:536 (+),score=115.00 TRINITY_DN5851_c0_g3_i1:737-2344(+)
MILKRLEPSLRFKVLRHQFTQLERCALEKWVSEQADGKSCNRDNGCNSSSGKSHSSSSNLNCKTDLILKRKHDDDDSGKLEEASSDDTDLSSVTSVGSDGVSELSEDEQLMLEDDTSSAVVALCDGSSEKDIDDADGTAWDQHEEDCEKDQGIDFEQKIEVDFKNAGNGSAKRSSVPGINSIPSGKHRLYQARVMVKSLSTSSRLFKDLQTALDALVVLLEIKSRLRESQHEALAEHASITIPAVLKEYGITAETFGLQYSLKLRHGRQILSTRQTPSLETVLAAYSAVQPLLDPSAKLPQSDSMWVAVRSELAALTLPRRAKSVEEWQKMLDDQYYAAALRRELAWESWNRQAMLREEKLQTWEERRQQREESRRQNQEEKARSKEMKRQKWQEQCQKWQAMRQKKEEVQRQQQEQRQQKQEKKQQKQEEKRQRQEKRHRKRQEKRQKQQEKHQKTAKRSEQQLTKKLTRLLDQWRRFERRTSLRARRQQQLEASRERQKERDKARQQRAEREERRRWLTRKDLTMDDILGKKF